MLSVNRCLDIASHKKSGFQHGGRRHCLFCILPGHLWSLFRKEYFHAGDLLPVPAAVPTESEGSLQRNAHLPRPLSPVPARFPHGSRTVPGGAREGPERGPGGVREGGGGRARCVTYFPWGTWITTNGESLRKPSMGTKPACDN